MEKLDVFLESDNIILRTVNRDDFGPAMVRWTNDREVTRFLWRGTFPANPEKLLQEYEQIFKDDQDVVLAIADKKTNKSIGVTGLHQVNWVARHAEFRILIGESNFWGKGIGTEVAQLMCAYGFSILNLNKVWLGVNSRNARAHQSYLKSGFKNEGQLRQEGFRNGEFFDVIRMSILKDEYDQAAPKWRIFPQIKRQLSK